MPDDTSTEGGRQLPQFEYVPAPLKLTLLKPVPQQDGSVRYLAATEDDLAEVLLSLGEEGMQRVGHLVGQKLQAMKEAREKDAGTPTG